MELAHTIMGNAHCINEPPNLLPSYRLISYGKTATLYVIDVQFVHVLFNIFFNRYLIFNS